MSDISQAYDDITAVIKTVLPDHYELINPYQVDLNDDLTFVKAWGMGFGPGVNANRQLGCDMSFDREMKLVITRKIFAGQLQRNTSAVTVRRDTEKALFEDFYLLLHEFETNPTITDSQVIGKFVYQNDAGLEFISTGKTDIIMLNMTFILSYEETL